jgi:calcineurin-like phosphoesterase
MHAEATSEKIALSWHLDGRVALVFGTHTHVPTADATIRPHGTAFITDAGMTGPYNGVIGRVKEAVLKKMRTNVHEPYSVADGDVRIGAVVVDVDERTGKATRIEPLFQPLPADVAATIVAGN